MSRVAGLVEEFHKVRAVQAVLLSTSYRLALAENCASEGYIIGHKPKAYDQCFYMSLGVFYRFSLMTGISSLSLVERARMRPSLPIRIAVGSQRMA